LNGVQNAQAVVLVVSSKRSPSRNSILVRCPVGSLFFLLPDSLSERLSAILVATPDTCLQFSFVSFRFLVVR
jgi:hypothetical protein